MKTEDLKLVALIALVIVGTIYVNQKYLHVERLLPAV
jgi:hypothetical protein